MGPMKDNHNKGLIQNINRDHIEQFPLYFQN